MMQVVIVWSRASSHGGAARMRELQVTCCMGGEKNACAALHAVQPSVQPFTTHQVAKMVFTCPVVAVSEPTATQSAIYRRQTSAEGFPTLDGIETLYESFEKSVTQHKGLPALGWRELDKVSPHTPMSQKRTGSIIRATPR